MLCRFSIAAFLTLLVATASQAQITLPYPTFSTPTILRAEVAANDAALASGALNRAGGTMTGGLAGTSLTLSSTLSVTGAVTLNSTLAVSGTTTLGAATIGAITLAGAILPSVTNVRDLGSSSFRFDEAYVRTLDVSLNSTLTGTLTVTNTQTFIGNTDLRGTLADSTGNLTIGDAVDVSGLITGAAGATITGTVTATTFSGSGASLTSVPETALTDGSVLARIAANESITGNWNWAGATTTNTSVALNADSTVNALRWGHPNSAYQNTLGAFDTSGNPFICFWCYHGPTANTLRRTSGAIPPAYFTVDGSGNLSYLVGSVGSADTDFTGTTLWTFQVDGDLVPGTDGYDIGTSAVGVDLYARQLIVDGGSSGSPGLSFEGSDDGVFRLNADEVLIGATLSSSSDAAEIIIAGGTLGGTPNVSIRTADGSTSSLAEVANFSLNGIWTQEVPIVYDEIVTTPSSPNNGTEAKTYVRNNSFVIQFNDAGTVRYKYLDLTGTGVTWVHSTSAP